MSTEMDDQKDLWILDPKADRNDGSAFFRGAAFTVSPSLPIWGPLVWLVPCGRDDPLRPQHCPRPEPHDSGTDGSPTRSRLRLR